jgi:endonuclease/exonuclease/phosphatase family metal-dependent hydrolase
MDRLKVLTINIWNRSGPWEKRLELIREGLATLEPDLIGLQEVLSMPGQQSQADHIAAGMNYRVHEAPAWELGGGVHFGNAILSRYDLIETNTFRLPGEGCEPRCLAFARVDTPCGAVPFFTTHLAWRPHEGPTRIEQITSIVAHLEALTTIDEFPPILCGDFNADSDSDEMRMLRGLTPFPHRSERGVYFADVWSYLAADQPMGPGYTYSRSNPYALRSREQSRRIDYVLVRGPDRALRGEPLFARVVFDEERGGVFASDHYGVYAEIQAAPRPHAPY